MSDKKYLSYYYLCYPQLVGTIQLSGGGGTSRNIYEVFKNPLERGSGQPVTCSTSGMGLRLK